MMVVAIAVVVMIVVVPANPEVRQPHMTETSPAMLLLLLSPPCCWDSCTRATPHDSATTDIHYHIHTYIYST